MKYDKFFVAAKEAGIEEAELYIHEEDSLSFELFHSEVVSYSNNKAMTIVARGIINGKFGAASCDTWNNDKCAYLVKEIKENALVVENDDPAIIFAGSPKYSRLNTFNKNLANVTFEEKLNKAKELEAKIKEADARINEVAEVVYREVNEATSIYNSKGLKLNGKTNYFYIYGVGVAEQNGQVKSGFELFLDNDFSKFDASKFAKKIADTTTGQLGGEPCESQKYKAVLSPSVVDSLLHAYVDYASSDEVQKKSSLFIGKLNEKVASNKITIEDRPLERTVFARTFDDEGVATYNKPIIKNGVLVNYLYNLKTAAKEGCETTGNGFKHGAQMGVSPAFIWLKPGNKTQEELFNKVGNGVYITEVSGLHAGLNSQSGNFSLQSSGYLIKNGKKDRPLDIITISGNLMKIFEDTLEVGNDTEVTPSASSVQSILIKELSVSGK